METANKETFLEDLRADARPKKDETFRKIYGYALYDPEYAEKALTRLEAEGCSRARELYAEWVERYETERDEMLLRVSEWYVGELHKDRESERREATREWKNSLMTMTSQELEKLCAKLLQNGIINDPSEFVTLARLVL